MTRLIMWYRLSFVFLGVTFTATSGAGLLNKESVWIKLDMRGKIYTVL